MIRFLIDAQLPPGLARRFASRGYPAEHVNRISLGIATDLAIWRHAARTGAIIVTKDEDFVALARRESHGPQVVWFASATSPMTHYGVRSNHYWTRSWKR